MIRSRSLRTLKSKCASLICNKPRLFYETVEIPHTDFTVHQVRGEGRCRQSRFVEGRHIKTKMGNGYGDITKVETTGASEETRPKSFMFSDGVRVSHKLAEYDERSMEEYKSKINRVGEKYDIDPALIAAIISRESNAGKTLKDGWGDYNHSRGEYNAWGLMQVDRNPNGGNHTPRGDWDSEEHLCQATGILVDFIKLIRNKFPGWTAEQQLKGGIAAYNAGDRKVHSYNKVDENTTSGDYSNDVVARAQWYKEHGF